MQRYVPFAIGEYYHIYNRGVDKNKVFYKETDWKHFQKLLFTRNSTNRIDSTRTKTLPLHKIDRGDTIVDLLAYVMMPNHFHLLLHEKVEGGISSFMRKFSTAYSMYINTKYKRSGPLMCRPFRAKHIDNDEYFKKCLSYIHSNPLELHDDVNRTEFLKNYFYSSYQDYLNQKREENVIIDKNVIPFDPSELNSIRRMEAHLRKEAPYA